MRSSMRILDFLFLFCCFCFSAKASAVNEGHCPKNQRLSIGVVIDQKSRVGKQQKIAMELAVHDFHKYHCLNLLYLHKGPANVASAVVDPIDRNQVDAILGMITPQEAGLISESELGSGVPIISLSPAREMLPDFPNLVQMSTLLTYQMQGIAALIGHFKWKKVILIHEEGNVFLYGSGVFSLFSDSLRNVGSYVDQHLAFPRITSLLDPSGYFEKKLKKLRSQNIRIFVVVQSSWEFAVTLFEKAKELEMMEKGYVWIVSDEMANLLDSIDSSIIVDMQGIVGLKTNYADSTEYLRRFKSRFRRKYASEYSEEDEANPSPSIHSFRAYDSIRSLAEASQYLKGKFNSTELVNRVLSRGFEGLSGKISFYNGVLSQKPVFQIVNVIGTGYRVVAMWSPDFGFSEDLVDLNRKRMGADNGLTRNLRIYWPGGDPNVPNGWSVGSIGTPLRIGVPAKGAFNQFVKVTHDPNGGRTLITGFSIEVFKAAVKHLPYDLHYVFVPYYGTYDEMVAEVHNKSLDAAVGDTEILAFRYVYAEFSQPYIDSGLVMVVTVKQGLRQSRFIALNVFTETMWILLAAMSISTGAVVWLSEHASGNEQFSRNSFRELIVSVLWLSVTVISLSQREAIRSIASKFVVATWLCVVFIVSGSFTAILSSMMTVQRLQATFSDIDYLRNTNAAIGCNGNSFIVQYLTDELHFRRENIREINSINEYHAAFENGTIKAAFFVAPHAKVFLAMYCKEYTISGPSFRLGGFGFVFPKGSQLAVDVSEALLKVTQSGQINILEKNMLHLSNCSAVATDDLRLGPEPFSGLFLFLVGIMAVAILGAIIQLGRMTGSCVHDLVQKVVMSMERARAWAALAFTEWWCTGFEPAVNNREEGIENVGGDHQVEPNSNHI